MQAILNKVIVKKQDVANKSKDGIVLGLDEESEKFAVGEVISIGCDVKNIKVGQTAWYDRHRSTDINIDGETFVIMDNFSIFVVKD